MDINIVTALFIIDQQKGITNPKLGSRNNKNAESDMLSLLSQWRKMGWPIIHIKHRSTDIESVFWPDQEGFEFRAEFLPRSNESVVEKQTPCAFAGTDLENLLHEKKIKSIIVTGASTNNSVEATVRYAGCNGFQVIVVENACFAFAKTDYFGVKRTAEDVHAMSLANLDNEYATVVHSSDIRFHSVSNSRS